MLKELMSLVSARDELALAISAGYVDERAMRDVDAMTRRIRVLASVHA